MTVVLECCKKSPKFDPMPSKDAWTENWPGDYIPDIRCDSKFHYDLIMEFCHPYMRCSLPNVHWVRYFFWASDNSVPKASAPILMLSTLKGIVPHKDLHVVGSKNEIYILTPIWNFLGDLQQDIVHKPLLLHVYRQPNSKLSCTVQLNTKNQL